MLDFPVPIFIRLRGPISYFLVPTVTVRLVEPAIASLVQLSAKL